MSKRTQNQATEFRISYERNEEAKKVTRLGTLKEGTRGHIKCAGSLAATRELIAELEGQLAARRAAGKGDGPSVKAPSEKEVKVEVFTGSEPMNDTGMVEFEVAQGDDLTIDIAV